MDKSKITGLGGLLAGIVGSVCCVGPVILGGLGFGVGVIGFVRDLGFLHIPMMALAFLLLGAAFYMRYQKADPQMGNSAACEVAPGKRNKGIVFLCTTMVLTLLLFVYPFLR